MILIFPGRLIVPEPRRQSAASHFRLCCLNEKGRSTARTDQLINRLKQFIGKDDVHTLCAHRWPIAIVPSSRKRFGTGGCIRLHHPECNLENRYRASASLARIAHSAQCLQGFSQRLQLPWYVTAALHQEWCRLRGPKDFALRAHPFWPSHRATIGLVPKMWEHLRRSPRTACNMRSHTADSYC